MKKKSWVKLLSMLMVVTMMMSVCMVQAFAAEDSLQATEVHSTYYGYQVDAEATYTSTPKFTFELKYEVTAGLEMDMYADFHDGYGHFESPSRTKYAEVASYILRDSLSPNNPTVYNCGNYGEAECWVVYNGAWSPRYYVQKTVQW